MRRRASDKLHVTVWSEGLNGGWEPLAAEVYPNDINTCIGQFLAVQPENSEADIHLRVRDTGRCRNMVILVQIGRAWHQ